MNMRALLWLALAIFLPVATSASKSGQFFVPPEPGPNQDYTENSRYVIGETRRIKFTTTFRDYTINLWQQSLTQSAATKGPAIFSVPDGAVTEFDWLVQLYQFDLSDSNVFFLWLNSSSDSSLLFSSHYFNITDQTSTSSTPTPSSSTASKSSLTLTRPSTTSPSPSSTTSPTPPSTPTPTLPPPNVLSTGAQAGIGVGAALAGLAAIIIAVVFYRRSRQQRSREPPNYMEGQGAGSTIQDVQYQEYKPQKPYETQDSVHELGHEPRRGHSSNIVELSAM
ncbi:hypothetical protein F5B18DRAFT_625260 [Nemania serpens]|nr:hypothetical protein F5B18DRAFT_625260 [Nemania serpens]